MKPKDRLKTVAGSAKVAAMISVALAFTAGFFVGQFKEVWIGAFLVIASIFLIVYAVDKSAK